MIDEDRWWSPVFDRRNPRRAVRITARSGSPPDGAREGGESLGAFLLDVAVPAQIELVLRAFWQRVRQESGWA